MKETVRQLLSYRCLYTEIRTLEHQLAEMKDTADPGIRELRAAMERRQLEAWRRLRACERVVAAQDDARLRTILRQYYLLGRRQREVADMLNLSERTVNRLLSRFRREG